MRALRGYYFRGQSKQAHAYALITWKIRFTLMLPLERGINLFFQCLNG